MAKRTLTSQILQFTPQDSNNPASLNDLDGESLLQLFHGFLSSLHEGRIKDPKYKKYLRVDEVKAVGRTVTVVTSVGPFGEPGATFDTETHEKIRDNSENDAWTSKTRTTLIVPPGDDAVYALFLIENRWGGTGGRTLVKEFHRLLNQQFSTSTFTIENVLETDAWMNDADLKQVKVVTYSNPVDLSETVGVERQIYVDKHHSALPPKGSKFFPRTIWDGLRNRSISAANIVGIVENEDTKTFFTLQREDRTKTFESNRIGNPPAQILLTHDGELPLSDAEFFKEAMKEARDLYRHSLELTWESQWLVGDWTEQQLQVKFP